MTAVKIFHSLLKYYNILLSYYRHLMCGLFYMLQFDAEKWKLENGSEVLLYSLSTHLPVRVKPDGTVDACGDFNDPLGLPSRPITR